MKSFTIAALFITSAVAFPNALTGAIQRSASEEVSDLPKLLKWKREKAKRTVSFDPVAQHVETTGDHAWKAPNFAAGDQRGPCPGLNALANHGYLPRNGVAPLTQFISATNEAYGMSLDLGGFLAVYGTVFDGNPLSATPGYSIGGPTSLSQNILGNVGGLIGNPQGLSGSHNKYEADSSPTRGDLYMYGNDFKVQVNQFQQYYDALVEGIVSTEQYDKLFDFRVSRFKDSVTRNPYFFFPPFAGLLVAPAGYAFPPAFMANHSAEFPEGTLSKESLMSFFAITGKSGNFKYNVGHERIPDNFYKRAIGDEYSIPGFLADVLDFGIKYPPLLDVAGNTGSPNSLTPVDLHNLTGGVFNTGTLAEGNNLECFVFQAIHAAAPDVLAGTFLDPTAAAAGITGKIATMLANAGCPQLEKIDTSQYSKYPGYHKSGGAV